jgi:phosphoribosylglycinamide formyltransferase-1
VNQEKNIVLALMASGNGTNAEAIMKHFQDHPQIRVGLLISNNPVAGALHRAEKFGVPNIVFNREQFKDGGEILKILARYDTTHVVLAGFLWLIPAYLIHAFPEKILNIHPSLLPRHGGKGMYGEKVHEAVKASGDLKSGITIHLVNERFDEGKIIFQASCEVNPADTPATIAAKVHQLEYQHFPTVIEDWVSLS